MDYLLVKWLHILSATWLFGIGLGSAYYKWMADRSYDMSTICNTNKHLVTADWVFIAPTVVLQPLTGGYLIYQSGLSLFEPWVLLSIGLFIIAGLCWLRVLYLQIEMRNISINATREGRVLTARYFALFKTWTRLGFAGFTAITVVIYLMVVKPAFH